jgi:hypothetical protein
MKQERVAGRELAVGCEVMVCAGFLLLALLGQASGAGCLDLSGRWAVEWGNWSDYCWVAENGSFESELEPAHEDLFLYQSGCNIWFFTRLLKPDGSTYTAQRVGAVTGRSLSFSGLAVYPTSTCTFSTNTMTATGTAQGNTIMVDTSVVISYFGPYEQGYAFPGAAWGTGSMFLISYRPMIDFTNLVSGQRVTNPTFTAMGTAADNEQVTAVWYRLNGGAWSEAAGFTNWAAPLLLSQRTNTLEVYARDNEDNQGPVDSRTFYYVVSDRLQVQQVGQGRIVTNYAGQMLELQRTYTMTATPTNGHRFDRWIVATNWGDGAIVSNKTLSFDMQSNLTITAVFLDTNRPTVTVSNLAADQRLSNAVYTVCGSARDNVSVSQVWWRLNQQGWSPTSGTTHWCAELQLQPGTNRFEVWAEDLAGNRSVTNSLGCVFVLCDTLQMRGIGQGRVVTNYAGQRLEIDRRYTMTATGTNGHRFDRWIVATNWGDGAIVTYKALTFAMQSNLTITVVFQDANRPTVKVAHPTPNQRITNAVVAAHGTATDNAEVLAVWSRMNSGPWVRAVGTQAWTNLLTLAPGTNTLQTYSQDAAGNVSPISEVKFVGLPAGAGTLHARLRRDPANPTHSFLNVSSLTARSLAVEVSTDLAHWTTLAFLTNASGAVEYPIANMLNNAQGFYRVWPLP